MFKIKEREDRKVNDIIAAFYFNDQRRECEDKFPEARDAIDAYYRMQSEAHIMNREFDAEHSEDIAVVMAANTGADVEYCRKVLSACGYSFGAAFDLFLKERSLAHDCAIRWNDRLDVDLLQIKANLATWPCERAEKDRASIIRYITYLNTGAIPK